MTNRKPMYETFAEFLDALDDGHVQQDKLRLICWTGSCAVTIEEEGDPIFEDGEEVDREPSTILLKVDSADLFAIQVIEAFGGRGLIS